MCSFEEASDKGGGVRVARRISDNERCRKKKEDAEEG